MGEIGVRISMKYILKMEMYDSLRIMDQKKRKNRRIDNSD